MPITIPTELLLGLGKPILRSATMRSLLLPRRSSSSLRSAPPYSPGDREDADQQLGISMQFLAKTEG